MLVAEMGGVLERLLAGILPDVVALLEQLHPAVAAEVVLSLGRPPGDWSRLTCAFLFMAGEHFALGKPLAFPPELAAYYLEHEDLVGPMPMAECASCGLSLPRVFVTCPHCGGEVRFGAYSIRMTAKAASN